MPRPLSDPERIAPEKERLRSILRRNYDAVRKRGDVARIATACGVTADTVNNWTIEGKGMPTIAELKVMADTLGVRPAWLAYDDGPQTAQKNDREHQLLSELRQFETPPYDALLAVLRSLPKPQLQPRPLTMRTRQADAAPLAIDRRNELKRFTIARHAATGPAIPQWLGLAAGEGHDLELSPDYIYFEELKSAKGIHSAVIKGDSMLMTLQPGDVVLLEEFSGGKFPLPQIESEEERMPLVQFQRESRIRDGEICAVSINQAPPTLKRITYDTERGELDWKLQIVADNPPAWRKGKPFQVAVGDSIVFHARLLGIAEEKLK